MTKNLLALFCLLAAPSCASSIAPTKTESGIIMDKGHIGKVAGKIQAKGDIHIIVNNDIESKGQVTTSQEASQKGVHVDNGSANSAQ